MSEDVGSEESVEEVESSAPEAVEGGQEVQTESPEQSVPSDAWAGFRQLEQFQGQDDGAIAQSLYEAMQREDVANRALQQYQSTIPIVQDYLNNRQDYEAWRDNRTAAPQQQAAAPGMQQQVQEEEKSWWNPPGLKDSHKRYLTRDENGREVIRAVSYTHLTLPTKRIV